MAQFDLPLEQLQTHRSGTPKPADFDEFWAATLTEARSFPVDATFTDYDAGLDELVVQDVRFSGFAGDRIHGWFLAPKHATGPLPVVVTYLGYGGGRGLPGEWTEWPSAGFAHLVVDSRGQGSGHRVGSTPDGPFTGPHAGGVLTLGIESPQTYYYRRLYTDAVRAVDAILEHPLIDPTRVTIAGNSQGGAITLAVAGLHEAPIAAMADVTFMSDIHRAIRITNDYPYAELKQWLAIHHGEERSRAEATVNYFDVTNFTPRATVPALFSVALMDTICPPSTVYAAYNAYAGPREIQVYEFNGHEHGRAYQAAVQRRWLKQRLEQLGE
jgi:cephalosporin-C deacetylase